MKRNLRALLLVVFVAIILGVVLGVFLSGSDDDEDHAPATTALNKSDPVNKSDPASVKKAVPTQKATPAKQEGAAKKVEPVRVPEDAAEQAPKTSATGSSQAVESQAIPPSFDVVRISPSGRAVIAGRAEPGAKVTVLDGGISIGSVYADERGEWVLLPEDALPAGDRELSLVLNTADGLQVPSEQVVVLSVPKPLQKPMITTQRGSEEQAGEAALDKSDRPDSSSVSATNEGVVAILVERDGNGPSRVLQSPDLAGEGIGEESEVTIRSVDYDNEGEMILAGRTEPNATVNVYIDEKHVGSAKADEDGDWQLTPEKDVEPGPHKLRVDKVDVEGVVLERIETPMSRADPEELLLGDALVVVQPGNSLWRIARRAYGGGAYYTEIYGANRGQILDPNIIFPGQILALPALN